MEERKYKVESLRGRVLQGDCIEKLRSFPDNSIDAVVTDPPYGLVSIVKRFGKAGSAPAKFGTDGAFARLSGSGPRPRKGEKNCAGSFCGVSCIEDSNDTDSNTGKELVPFRITVSSVPMVLRSVDLNDGGKGWEIEVNGDSAPRSSEGLLVDERYSKFAKVLDGGEFTFRKASDSSLCIGVCTCLAQPFFAGRAVLVRLGDKVLGESERTTGIVAGGGAECRAVLTFDLRRGTGELHPAEGASECGTCVELVPAEFVGADAGTGGFTPPSESKGVGHVGFSTDRAGLFCVRFHKDLLKRMDDPIIGPTGFMSKKWDGSGIEYSVEFWKEVLRVMKPGAHLVAAGGSRTFHRMVCAIEDAGFEVRDCISHCFGSGFPKSANVSKMIDKAGGISPKEQALLLRKKREESGMGREQVASAVGCTVSSIRDWEEGRARATGRPIEWIVPSDEYRSSLADLLGYSKDERVVTGVSIDRREDGTTYKLGHSGVLRDGGKTNAAKQWEGWGTALKPAVEYWSLCRKPLSEGTVAANVLRWGTGCINIDASRIGTEQTTTIRAGHSGDHGRFGKDNRKLERVNPPGRFPANLILSHDERCVRVGTKRVRGSYLEVHHANNRKEGGFLKEMKHPGKQGFVGEDGKEAVEEWACVPGCPVRMLDEQSVGASRFFYCAKASRWERNAGCGRTGEKKFDSIELVTVEWQSWENEARKVKLLVDTGTSPPRVTGASCAPCNDVSEWNTFLFGKGVMGRFQRGTASTTKTGISSTTESKTLNWFLSSITRDSTEDVRSGTGSGGNPVESAGCGTLYLTTTNEKTESLRGVGRVASRTQLKISVCEGQRKVAGVGVDNTHPT